MHIVRKVHGTIFVDEIDLVRIVFTIRGTCIQSIFRDVDCKEPLLRLRVLSLVARNSLCVVWQGCNP